MSDEKLAELSQRVSSKQLPDMIGEDRDSRSARENPRICFGFEVIQDYCDRSIQDSKPINPLILKDIVRHLQLKATQMEYGLRMRKTMMEGAGLEEQYQENKLKHDEARNKKDAINKSRDVESATYDEEPLYEVEVKQNGEVIYSNMAYAGLISFVERVDSIIPERAEINGQVQHFQFGNNNLVYYAFDRLYIACEQLITKIVWALKLSNGVSKQQMLIQAKDHYNVKMKALKALEKAESTTLQLPMRGEKPEAD